MKKQEMTQFLQANHDDISLTNFYGEKIAARVIEHYLMAVYQDSNCLNPDRGPNETYYCSTRGEYAYELRELAKENE